MSIDIETARRVAHLARIAVDDADLPALQEDFNRILGFIEQLNEVDVEGVEPMTSVTPMRLKRRTDEVTAGGEHQDGALQRARRARGLLRRAEGGGMSLNTLTIAEARDELRSGEITAVELTAACLEAVETAGALNAVVHRTNPIALAQAKMADQRFAAGDAPSMCGIPIGVKDLFCTEGVPSQAGSRILEASCRPTS